MIPRIFNPHNRSLLRGAVLVLLSLGIAFLLSGFPDNKQNPLIALTALSSIAGTIDHVRCMSTKWSWYHGGVILMIYMDLMATGMILFFLLYPYAQWLTAQ
ncbi:MAG: permease [Acidobacteria bacterium]|nr:permease [Acidobacteriota bacterium]